MELELTVFSHTALALAALYGAYKWGRRTLSQDAVTFILATLEEEGLIKTVLDEDGEKEILKPLTWENNGG